MTRKPLTIEQAAARAYLELDTCTNPAAASVTLLRRLSEAFGDRTLEHAANRIAGEAGKPGKTPIDDTELLERVASLEAQGPCRDAIGTVARQAAHGDRAKQETIARRLREKRAKGKRS
jgi:hypothetical protein